MCDRLSDFGIAVNRDILTGYYPLDTYQPANLLLMLTPALLMPVRLATFTIIESHNTHQRRPITSRIFPVASLTGASRFLFLRTGVVSFAIFISLACGFPTSSGWLVGVADWKLAAGITPVWFCTVRARIGFSGFNKISTNTWKLTVDQSIINCTW